jgi:hypothetical protein
MEGKGEEDWEKDICFGTFQDPSTSTPNPVGLKGGMEAKYEKLEAEERKRETYISFVLRLVFFLIQATFLLPFHLEAG